MIQDEATVAIYTLHVTSPWGSVTPTAMQCQQEFLRNVLNGTIANDLAWPRFVWLASNTCYTFYLDGHKSMTD